MTLHGRSVRTLLTLFALTIASSVTASAITVNFDNQGLTGPDNFEDAGSPQTINVNTSAGRVTLTGGVILTNTRNLDANPTSIYATASGFDPGLDNLLTITFERPVRNFFLDVGNGGVDAISYRVRDNVGNVSDFTLDPVGGSGAVQRIGFEKPGTSIQTLMISTDIDYFVFYIDNLEFEATSPPGDVPEPSSLWMLGSGLSACALFFKRSRRI